MAGKESRSKGSGRGLKGKTGFSGDDGGGVRGDKDASPADGIGAEKSLGRFEGRTSRSSPRGMESAPISKEKWTRARQGQREHGAIDLARHVQPNYASPSATKAEDTLRK